MAHRCGPGCDVFDRLSRIANLRHRMAAQPQTFSVVTWCQVCGEEELLEVPANYADALALFHQMDDTPRVHGSHIELTNWGTHFRLDDVLFVLFPREHGEEVWPMASWWHLEYGEPKSSGHPIQILSNTEKDARRMNDFEVQRLALLTERELRNRGKEELLAEFHSVWSVEELRKEFEVYIHQPPFVIARRIQTDQLGTLRYQNGPRYYYGWTPDLR